MIKLLGCLLVITFEAIHCQEQRKKGKLLFSFLIFLSLLQKPLYARKAFSLCFTKVEKEDHRFVLCIVKTSGKRGGRLNCTEDTEVYFSLNR
ncbi:hypothetical protein CEXT_385901 [Caerostris extrusa]|uniref:Secreted protein n=1 Tax=Caerostris extrusa TaxID=172846 RepID=A0AAV4NZ74_CAEEX|nr:hypothetical protein CEXT_385901 [Caerostris extrusa]